ncbi:MAG TPA: aldo/keto reductase, partial [Terriglobales bacterium]|nr:aldo/keto reductase [Terriglobales bacterium]
MHYRTLGKTGMKVSEISFGAWAIGGTSEAAGEQWGWGETPERDALAALEKARALGVNFFDTADVYGDGRSEEVLGKAFGGKWDGVPGRSAVMVASKVGNVVRGGVGMKDWSREHITRSCEQSLKRLKKDVIELYQLHNPAEEDIRKGDWPETMELLVQQGKIRWYGVSVFLPEEAMAVLERGAGATIQLAYNALRQEMAPDVLPLAQKKDFGIIARVPLYYGVLTGKYSADTKFATDDHRSHTLPPETMRELAPRVAKLRSLAGGEKDMAGEANLGSWALRFAISHDAISCAIPGGRNPQQVERNCAASDKGRLSEEQVAAAHQWWAQDK